MNCVTACPIVFSIYEQLSIIFLETVTYRLKPMEKRSETPAQSQEVGLGRRRQALKSSTDARAVRTRDCIIAALNHLAENGSEITVSALVREAGISRGTFYTHFSGLEELAVAMQAEVVHFLAGLERTEAHLDPAETIRSRKESIAEALAGVVGHYARYQGFYAAVFSLPISQAAAKKRVEALAIELEEHMCTDAVVPPHVNVKMAALFIAGGWTTVISEWVLGNVQATEAQVAEHLVELVPEWLYRLRGRS